MSFPSTILHCNNKALAPAVIAAATDVPLILPGPPGYIPPTFTPGAAKSGKSEGSLEGPHEDVGDKLPSALSYAPQVITPVVVPGNVIV